ncbi:hypothetical protein [uncultured Alsobacter sp.]|uniref:hypothetical protein n=1 Tax=uncultured Alsobacter sp. TaxID=1748258 RepID=UPI0025FBC9F2|nr:hypothetical protein [uncultured Alsobacter sp.]
MQVGGVTEIISHFVGDLRIALENERVDVILDGAASRPTSPDALRPLVDQPLPHGDVEIPDSLRALRLDGPLSDPAGFHLKLAPGLLAARTPTAPAPLAPGPIRDPVNLASPSGGGSSAWVHIDGGDLEVTQSHVHVSQSNFLVDNDIFAPVIPGLEIAVDPALLWDLVKASVVAGPDGSAVLELPQQSMIDAIVKQMQSMAPESPSMVTMPQGTSIDGVLVSADPPMSHPIDPVFVNPFEGWAGIDQRPVAEPLPEDQQTVTTGANTAANVAVLVDGTGQALSMIVVGDVYRTNSIVQVNVLHDQDTVTLNGASEPQIETGHNLATNIAHFDDVGVYKSLGGATGFSGHWTTTIVDGDFYSVQALIQRNWIVDNDLVVRQESSTAFNLVMGENTGVNNAGFIVNGMHYDMIVVGKNLYSTNAIYQHNVVLDDDWVTLSRPDGSTGTWHMDTGGNVLTNEAWIRDIGSGGFQGMTPQARAFAEAATSGLDTADATKMAGFAAPSDQSLDILVVTGNYYDIRIVSQTNVIGDADTVASLAAAAEDGGAKQVIHTGGNAASNAAAIINVGALTDVQYAGGQIYEASTLIQTNIISSDATVTSHAFDALAPEVVAFVDHDPHGHDMQASHDALSQASTLHPVTQNPDVLGSVMT